MVGEGLMDGYTVVVLQLLSNDSVVCRWWYVGCDVVCRWLSVVWGKKLKK